MSWNYGGGGGGGGESHYSRDPRVQVVNGGPWIDLLPQSYVIPTCFVGGDGIYVSQSYYSYVPYGISSGLINFDESGAPISDGSELLVLSSAVGGLASYESSGIIAATSASVEAALVLAAYGLTTTAVSTDANGNEIMTIQVEGSTTTPIESDGTIETVVVTGVTQIQNGISTFSASNISLQYDAPTSGQLIPVSDETDDAAAVGPTAGDQFAKFIDALGLIDKHMPSGAVKTALGLFVDAVQAAELGHDIGSMATGDLHNLIQTAAEEVFEQTSAWAAGEMAAAIAGSVGIETGPVGALMAAAAGVGTGVAWTHLPTTALASDTADALLWIAEHPPAYTFPSTLIDPPI